MVDRIFWNNNSKDNSFLGTIKYRLIKISKEDNNQKLDLVFFEIKLTNRKKKKKKKKNGDMKIIECQLNRWKQMNQISEKTFLI